MPPSKPENDREGLHAVVLVGQLGATISLPVAFGALAGAYLDLGPFVLVALIILGVVVGIGGAYRIVKPYLE